MSKRSRLLAVALALIVAPGVLVTAQRQQAVPRGIMRIHAESGQALRDWDNRVVSMERTRELRVRTVQVDTLVRGRRNERLDQYYKGVPVFGGEVVRETDGQQLTQAITTSLYAGVNIDTNPTLSEADAVAAFQRETGAPSTDGLRPELMILPKDNAYVLTYRMTAFVNHERPVVFINAKTGAVELRYNNLQTQATALVGNGVLVSEGLVASDQKKVMATLEAGTYQAWDQMRPMAIRTYDLKGDWQRVDRIVDGKTPLVASDIATNTGTTWQDSVVVDAHTYVGWTYDYYYKRMNFSGIDGANRRPMYVIVHPASRSKMTSYNWSDVGVYYANAFFCGQCGQSREDIVVFGEGLPAGYYMTSSKQYVDYYAASMSIVAHEYSHGVTGYTSNLVYMNESGALNEAFSDIMGTAVTYFHEGAGAGLLQADYSHGKETYRPSKNGGGYGSRSLANPAAQGDPDHYSKRYTGTDDNGGVHTNSTIASHAYYLAVEGGVNRTSGLAVTGVGTANREQVEKAFFQGFTTLPGNATFSQARAKTIAAAQSLYGVGSAADRAITQAWSAVGVF